MSLIGDQPQSEEELHHDLGHCTTFVIAGELRLRGWTVTDLANRAGLKYNTFRERYNKGTVTLNDLERIAPVFGQDPDAIVKKAFSLRGHRAQIFFELLYGAAQLEFPDMPHPLRRREDRHLAAV